MATKRKAEKDNLYNEELAKRFFDDDTEQIRGGQTQSSTLKSDVSSSTLSTQQSSATASKAASASRFTKGAETISDDHKKRSSTDNCREKNVDTKASLKRTDMKDADQAQTTDSTVLKDDDEDDEDAWETASDDESKVNKKPKREKKGRRRRPNPAPWDSDSDMFDDYGYDEFGGYEPELFMGDPRDREVAEILYGPGAGYNPVYFSDRF